MPFYTPSHVAASHIWLPQESLVVAKTFGHNYSSNEARKKLRVCPKLDRDQLFLAALDMDAPLSFLQATFLQPLPACRMNNNA